MFEQYKLKNHARVILVPQENTHSVTVMVVFPVGSRHETAKLNGVSHYIEHLMFKGTKKRKNTLILTREIDRLGADYNAFTSKDHTAYHIKTDCKYIETTLDILSDMLFHSTFDAREMEREKTVIVEELRMYKDNPLMHIDTVLEEVLFAGCPLGRDIGGSEKTVLAFRRPEALAFKARHYNPSNLTIIVAGEINPAVRRLVDKYFGREHRHRRVSGSFKAAAFGSEKKEARIAVQRKNTTQVQMRLGFPGFSYQARVNPAVTVMNLILGGSMSSRLFIQIRERRGLAYSVGSGAENFADIGYVYIGAGLEAKNINRAIAVIKQEIEKMADLGVTKRELADAKTSIRGRMTLAMEDSRARASWYAHQSLFADKLKTPEEKLKVIEAVSAREVKDLVGKIFAMDKMRVAIIGDVQASDIKY